GSIGGNADPHINASSREREVLRWRRAVGGSVVRIRTHAAEIGHGIVIKVRNLVPFDGHG
ncbi:hypothetical protein COCVIDRAFT_99556, partial [Bipolaris victoriae FI3]